MPSSNSCRRRRTNRRIDLVTIGTIISVENQEARLSGFSTLVLIRRDGPDRQGGAKAGGRLRPSVVV
jgi:hypothetical protein